MRFRSMLLTPVVAMVAVATLTGVGIAIERWSANDGGQSDAGSIAQTQTTSDENLAETASTDTTEVAIQPEPPTPRPAPSPARTVSYEDDDSDEHEYDYDDEYEDD